MVGKGRASAIDRLLELDDGLPHGHYAHATALGSLIFVSGQLPPLDDDRPADPSFEGQTRAVLSQLFGILKRVHSSPAEVLRVTAYIVGSTNWLAFNRLFAEAFGDARPARSVVPVFELHYGALVEIDAIAARNPPDQF